MLHQECECKYENQVIIFNPHKYLARIENITLVRIYRLGLFICFAFNSVALGFSWSIIDEQFIKLSEVVNVPI